MPTLPRRSALALAGAFALTLGAASAAVATNPGLFGGGAPKDVGTLDAKNVSALLPTTTAAPAPVEPEIQYVDETVVIPGAPAPEATEAAEAPERAEPATPAVPASPASGGSAATPAQPAQPATPPAVSQTPGGHEGEYEAEHDEDEHHESPEHEADEHDD